MRGQVLGELKRTEYWGEEAVLPIPLNVRHRFLNSSDQSTHILVVVTTALV